MTVIATGLSSVRKAQMTPPLTVVQQQPAQQPQAHLRTGTDNLPILNQVAQRRLRQRSSRRKAVV